jgi:hypothetical protein
MFAIACIFGYPYVCLHRLYVEDASGNVAGVVSMKDIIKAIISTLSAGK